MNTEKLNTKRIILLALIVLISLFNIFTLLFNIVNIEASAFGTHLAKTVNGFSVMHSYPVALENIGGWLCAYSIIHLIASFAILILVAVFFFKKTWQEFIGVAKVTSVISCVMSIIYMFNGIGAMSEAEEYGQGLYQLTSGAFVPFILILIFTIFFFAVMLIMKEEFSFQKNSTPASVQTSEVDVATELLKYKNLLEQNLITEEEFEAKKKQLLNL